VKGLPIVLVATGLAAAGAATVVGDGSGAKRSHHAVAAKCSYRALGQAFRRQGVLTVAGERVGNEPVRVRPGQWIEAKASGGGWLCLKEGQTKCQISAGTRLRFRPPNFPRALISLARGLVTCGSRRPPGRYFQTRSQLIKLDNIPRPTALGLTESIPAVVAAPTGGYVFSIEARRGTTKFRVRRGRTAVARLARLDQALIIGRDEKVTLAAGQDPTRPAELTAAERRAFDRITPSLALPPERDSAPPAIELTGPAQVSSLAGATLTFRSIGEPAVFTCSLDAEPFRICESAVSREALSRASCHRFTVRATDAAGRTTTKTVTWFVDDSRIALTSLRDDNPELYTIPPDGVVDAVRVTRDTDPERLFSDEDPSWSPDLRRLAFERPSVPRSSNLDIYVIDADGSGSGLTNLTQHPARDLSPAWSPDGRSIAFDSRRTDGHRDIYVMNADGTNVRRLTTHQAEDFDAAWSPDSRSIAFASNRDGGNLDIYVLSVDVGEGSGPTRLTSDEAQDYGPDWSPDGKRIAFHSRRQTGYYNIWVLNPAGTEVDARPLTRTQGNDFYPSWAPDNRHIVFYSERSDVGREPDLFIIDSETLNQGALTAHDRTNYLPDWSGPGPANPTC
jgi:Tol biopolymer transport system component